METIGLGFGSIHWFSWLYHWIAGQITGFDQEPSYLSLSHELLYLWNHNDHTELLESLMSPMGEVSITSAAGDQHAGAVWTDTSARTTQKVNNKKPHKISQQQSAYWLTVISNMLFSETRKNHYVLDFWIFSERKESGGIFTKLSCLTIAGQMRLKQ